MLEESEYAEFHNASLIEPHNSSCIPVGRSGQQNALGLHRKPLVGISVSSCIVTVRLSMLCKWLRVL